MLQTAADAVKRPTQPGPDPNLVHVRLYSVLNFGQADCICSSQLYVFHDMYDTTI